MNEDYFSSVGFIPSLRRLTALISSSTRAELFVKDKQFRLSPKRIMVIIGLSIFLPVHCCVQHFGFWLDSVLFPDWAKTKVVRPVFVVSNARSGSTLLQRLMFSHGKEQFSSITVWEMLFAQSVTYRWIYSKLSLVDKTLLFGLVSHLIHKADSAIARYTSGHSPHPFSLLSPDEDEWAMSTFGNCQLLGLLFPLLQPNSPLMRLVDFDHALSLRERCAVFDAYKTITQRHLYFDIKYRGKASSVRYLAKNPTFTLRLESLLCAFPDASVVCMVRDPYDAIPSMVSYITGIWSLVASPLCKYPFRDELQTMCGPHYTYPKMLALTASEKFPGAQFQFLKYEQVTENAPVAIRNMLAHLGLKSFGNEEYESFTFSYEHKHSVEETLGLSPKIFQERHHQVFDAYPEYRRVV